MLFIFNPLLAVVTCGWVHQFLPRALVQTAHTSICLAARSSSSVVKYWSAWATIFLCTMPSIPPYCLGLRFSRHIRLEYLKESLTLCWMLPMLSLQKSKASSCPGTLPQPPSAQGGPAQCIHFFEGSPYRSCERGGVPLGSHIAWIVCGVDRCLLQDVTSQIIIMYGTFMAGATLWPGRCAQSMISFALVPCLSPHMALTAAASRAFREVRSMLARSAPYIPVASIRVDMISILLVNPPWICIVSLSDVTLAQTTHPPPTLGSPN